MNIVIFRVYTRRSSVDLWLITNFIMRSMALDFFRSKRKAGRQCILTESIETQLEAANLDDETREEVAAPDISG